MHADLLLAPRAAPIRAMMRPYLAELVPDGPTVYPRLGQYWEDTARLPYLIVVEGADAGFALVREHDDTGFHEMAEFYVAPAWRRRGIGRAAAHALFARHPGWWHLQVLDANARAQAFWTSVIPEPVHREHRVAANGRRFTVVRFHAPQDG